MINVLNEVQRRGSNSGSSVVVVSKSFVRGEEMVQSQWVLAYPCHSVTVGEVGLT